MSHFCSSLGCFFFSGDISLQCLSFSQFSFIPSTNTNTECVRDYPRPLKINVYSTKQYAVKKTVVEISSLNQQHPSSQPDAKPNEKYNKKNKVFRVKNITFVKLILKNLAYVRRQISFLILKPQTRQARGPEYNLQSLLETSTQEKGNRKSLGSTFQNYQPGLSPSSQ